jgi:uncharacterized protein
MILTFNDLKQDAGDSKVLLEQPVANATKKATLIGHSEGTTIAPRVAVDHPDKVRNTLLMGAVAQNLKDLLYFQTVSTPLVYVERILDKSKQGHLSVKESSEDPIFQTLVGGNLTHLLFPTQTNVTDDENKTIELQHEYDASDHRIINLECDLKPALLAVYENITASQASALSANCLDVLYQFLEWNGGLQGCPLWIRSHSSLDSTLSMTGNVSSSTSILILQGENDTATPVEQGLLLQQRLTEVNHPAHLIITYPDLGHLLSPSREWITSHQIQ